MPEPRIDSTCLPSNQWNPTGVYDGAGPEPFDYEKDIWEPASRHFKDEMEQQGHTCKVVYLPPSGDSNNDELHTMCQQSFAYLKTVKGYPLAVSLHSNVGSGVNYMMPLVLDSRHDAFAAKVGKDAAVRCGMPYHLPYHRSIYFTRIHDPLGPGHVMLFETGEHSTAKDAAWLGKYAPFCARMEARSLIVACGFSLKHDGPVPASVVVPAGQQFDKWRPGTVAPPDPLPPTITLPTLRLTSPLMRDEHTGKDAIPALPAGPVAWLQATLNAHQTPVLPRLEVDGKYGPLTAANVREFQATHWWLGKHLEATGECDAATWAKARTV